MPQFEFALWENEKRRPVGRRTPLSQDCTPQSDLKAVARQFRDGKIAENPVFSGLEHEVGSNPRRLRLQSIAKMYGPGAVISFAVEVSLRGIERFPPDDRIARIEPDHENGETLKVLFYHELSHAYQITASPGIACEVLNQKPGEFRVRLNSEGPDRVRGKLVVTVLSTKA